MTRMFSVLFAMFLFLQPADTTDQALLKNRDWFDNFYVGYGNYKIYQFREHSRASYTAGNSDSFVATWHGQFTFPDKNPKHLSIFWRKEQTWTDTTYTVEKGNFEEFNLRLTLQRDFRNGNKESIFYSWLRKKRSQNIWQPEDNQNHPPANDRDLLEDRLWQNDSWPDDSSQEKYYNYRGYVFDKGIAAASYYTGTKNVYEEFWNGKYPFERKPNRIRIFWHKDNAWTDTEYLIEKGKFGEFKFRLTLKNDYHNGNKETVFYSK